MNKRKKREKEKFKSYRRRKSPASSTLATNRRFTRRFGGGFTVVPQTTKMANMEKELSETANTPFEDINTSKPRKSEYKIVGYPQATATAN